MKSIRCYSNENENIIIEMLIEVLQTDSCYSFDTEKLFNMNQLKLNNIQITKNLNLGTQ